MNERIGESALRAADEIADLFATGFFDDTMVYHIATIIKYHAERTVQECIIINRQELAYNAFTRVLNRYQEHFGNDDD